LLDGVEAAGPRHFRRSLDVGYVGQSYQVTVPVEDALSADAVFDLFATLYRDKYGYFYDDVPAEIVNLRVFGEIEGAGLQLTPAAGSGGDAAATGARAAAFSPAAGAMIDFAVYDRGALAPGMKFTGPAIVEEQTSTTIIDSDAAVEIDSFGSLVITLPGETP
jgi:N-methylhydantoinase A